MSLIRLHSSCQPLFHPLARGESQLLCCRGPAHDTCLCLIARRCPPNMHICPSLTKPHSTSSWLEVSLQQLADKSWLVRSCLASTQTPSRLNRFLFFCFTRKGRCCLANPLSPFPPPSPCPPPLSSYSSSLSSSSSVCPPSSPCRYAW